MPTETPDETIPTPGPDIIRPPAPTEAPPTDSPQEVPEPGPDVIVPPEPERPSPAPPETPPVGP